VKLESFGAVSFVWTVTVSYPCMGRFIFLDTTGLAGILQHFGDGVRIEKVLCSASF
jgi:hypothetical protein